MNRALRFVLALTLTLSAAAAVLLPRTARAEAPSAKALPVYVLTISTEDSDDQADALTQSMRSRVRQAQGWSLLETPQSFETLAIALKCPPKPDQPCLQRIADQDGGRLVECLVAGRPAAAQIVIIQRGEIVVDQRIGVQHLQRRAEFFNLLRQRTFDHAASLHAQNGP